MVLMFNCHNLSVVGQIESIEKKIAKYKYFKKEAWNYKAAFFFERKINEAEIKLQSILN